MRAWLATPGINEGTWGRDGDHHHPTSLDRGMEKTLANRYNRAKAMQSRAIQAYHARLFGGKKSMTVGTAITNIAAKVGCDRNRNAVLEFIRGEAPKVPPPVQVQAKPLGKDFYESWAWKEARFAALKRHGRQCQCCGWTPGSSVGNYLVVDHVKPIRTHPQLALDPDNHQVLCNDCNMGKSFKHHDDFR